jgi:hypothetical protein
MQVTWEQAVLTLAAAFVSGALGVGISTWYYRRHQRRCDKLDTLTRLLGYRFDILGSEFSRALNEVFVVFHDSQHVLAALQEFHQVVLTRQTQLANDKLVSLLKALCHDVDIDPAAVNDSFFLQPFNITAESAQQPGDAR